MSQRRIDTVPQVGELDRTTYTVSIEASFAVVLFSGVSTE